MAQHFLGRLVDVLCCLLPVATQLCASNKQSRLISTSSLTSGADVFYACGLLVRHCAGLIYQPPGTLGPVISAAPSSVSNPGSCTSDPVCSLERLINAALLPRSLLALDKTRRDEPGRMPRGHAASRLGSVQDTVVKSSYISTEKSLSQEQIDGMKDNLPLVSANKSYQNSFF
ncbi:unnamed protein product [Protopolystoma xenopodis]|uniref:Uncharacterized protein n=1 Tax=Protopolystoma xenopodis TaxID=117903 RepID=A0A448WX45_9PLAT|nr:unnamed protein product [Protopolystoma xenopodis]